MLKAIKRYFKRLYSDENVRNAAAFCHDWNFNVLPAEGQRRMNLDYLRNGAINVAVTNLPRDNASAKR